MPNLFHNKIGRALGDPTSWASISTLAFASMTQACPPEWTHYCWAGAVFSGVMGILLKGGGNA